MGRYVIQLTANFTGNLSVMYFTLDVVSVYEDLAALTEENMIDDENYNDYLKRLQLLGKDTKLIAKIQKFYRNSTFRLIFTQPIKLTLFSNLTN